VRLPLNVKIFAALTLLAAPLRAQCGPPDENAPKLHDSLLVSTAWLAQHLHDPDLVIVHVNHMSNEYATGHIPGARQLDAMKFTTGDWDVPPVATLDSLARALGITDRSRVVIYGDPWATGIVFVAMDVMGRGDRTAILDGGLPAWRAEGRPVTTAASAPARGTFTMHHEPDHIVDADWIRAHQADEHVAVLDVRSPQEYQGTGSGMMATKGHITGAHYLDWSRIFVQPNAVSRGGGDSHLIPAADLRALFREAGLRPGMTPVTYCTVGMRASQMYFVLRYLGYEPKFYDGSYNDWMSHHYATTTGTARGTP
jgi:thiosulfate/3-mercaptopyruvate sulfurtransferase